jgi:hypothetical protein
MVCFCFPLETYHTHLSSITVYNAAPSHLNNGNKQLAKTKMHMGIGSIYGRDNEIHKVQFEYNLSGRNNL